MLKANTCKNEKVMRPAPLFQIDYYYTYSSVIDATDVNEDPLQKYTLMMLLGAGIYKSGNGGSKYFCDSPNAFYNKLVGRCFKDVVKTDQQDTFEKYLQMLSSVDTQKACVMYAVFAYNLPGNQKQRFNALAPLLDSNINTDSAMLKDIDEKVTKASHFIDIEFKKCPELKQAITDSYYRQFPEQFIKYSNQAKVK